MQTGKVSVVQVIDRLHTGGAERVLVQLANLLHAHGHKVAVVTTVSTGPLAALLHPGITLTCLHRRWKWNPITMHRLISLVRPFDVVHVHSAHNLRYLLLSAKLFGLRKPVFFHEHFGDININRSASWIKKWLYSQTWLIAVSNQIASWARQEVSMPDKQVFVLPNIIIKETYQHADTRRADELNLVIVSNIRPTKNIAFAVQVCKALSEAINRKLHLDIIGQPADATYYDEMKQLIHACQLDQHITFITDCHNVQPLLHRYHLALHTAVSESGPLVLIEYLAQQLPFITYATGEVAAQVQHDLPGMVVDHFNIPQWVGRIQAILQADQEQLRQHMAALFQQHYSPESYYQRCIEIYKKGLQGSLQSSEYI